MRFRTSMIAGAMALCASHAARADKNVLVLIVDDAAVDKWGSYAADYPGYAPSYLPVTTELDKLAARGLRFRHAWATPECSPTRISFMTGQQPWRNGVGKALGNGAAGIDWGKRYPIAMKFHAHSYATGHFGKWHMGTQDINAVPGIPASPITADPNPAVAGFDRYWGAYDGVIGNYTNWTRVEWRGGAHTGTVATETTHATKATQEKALDWIKQQTGPWFAVVAFNAPHSPLLASSGWTYADATGIETYAASNLGCLATSNCTGNARQVEQQIYQGLMEDVDIKIGKLLAGIDPTVLDNTVIYAFGDNGTPSRVEESVFDVTPSRGKATTYENGVRVPLVVADGYAWRTNSAGSTITYINKQVDAKVHIYDLYNTLQDDNFGTVDTFQNDSTSFKQCFTNGNDPNRWCGWTAPRNGYSEMYDSTGGIAAVSHGLDTMVITGTVGGCLDNYFYDGATDDLQTTSVTPWPGNRSQRLRDQFNMIHAGGIDWANPTGTAVTILCR